MDAAPSPITAPEAKKGTLLVVDDDALQLKLFTKVFSKHYHLFTAQSGTEAIEVLKQGIKPEVILTDQRMPQMTGAELLEHSIQIVPDSIRVIITAHSEPKEIISCINKGHAYMFLSKPIEEIELVQAINLCFKHYHSVLRIKRLAHELKVKTEELNNVIKKSEPNCDKVLIDLFSALNTSDKVYVKNFAHSVEVIAEEICKLMKLPQESVNAIKLAANMYSFILDFLPQHLAIKSPEELSDEEQFAYFEYFNKAIEKIKKNEQLAKVATILSQIWEHFDGSGEPRNLKGSQIAIEAQVLSIANAYHHNVYAIPEKQIEEKCTREYFSLSIAELAHRNKAMTKYYFDRTKWWEQSVFNSFRYLLQDKSCEALLPERKELSVPNKEFDAKQLKKSSATANTDEFTYGGLMDGDSSGDVSNMVEKEIALSQLREGMMLGQTIITKTGVLVAKQGMVLNESLANYIKSLDNSGQLRNKDKIEILVPKGN